MKKVNVKYIVKSIEQFDVDLCRLITVFAPDAGAHLEINLILSRIQESEIKEVVRLIQKCKIFKDIYNENIYTFIFTVPSRVRIVKSLVKVKYMTARIDVLYEENMTENFLKKAFREKMTCNIVISAKDIDNAYALYKKVSRWGCSISLDNTIGYNMSFINYFRDWIYDKDGTRFNIFADVLSYVLLDYWGSKCQHKSCITRYFTIGENGDVFACKERKYKICNFDEIESINQLYSKKVFAELLELAIAKREGCKAECEYFEACRGGCVLCSGGNVDECEDRFLFEILSEVNGLVKEVIANEDFGNLNRSFRNIILSSVSSNKIFGKGFVQ